MVSHRGWLKRSLLVIACVCARLCDVGLVVADRNAGILNCPPPFSFLISSECGVAGMCRPCRGKHIGCATVWRNGMEEHMFIPPWNCGACCNFRKLRLTSGGESFARHWSQNAKGHHQQFKLMQIRDALCITLLQFCMDALRKNCVASIWQRKSVCVVKWRKNIIKLHMHAKFSANKLHPFQGIRSLRLATLPIGHSLRIPAQT